MAIVNKTEYASKNGDVPALPGHAFALTASDTPEYVPSICVYVGVAGNVAVIPDRGDGTTVVTFLGMPAGQMVPVRCKKVMAATTATNLIGVV